MPVARKQLTQTDDSGQAEKKYWQGDGVLDLAARSLGLEWRWFRLKVWLGLDLRLKVPERRFFEQVVTPALLRLPHVDRVLSVGCDWYTRGYAKLYRSCEYWTIDIDPAKARFGSPRHVVGSLTDLDRLFPPAWFDLIVCNGVFGWGIDTRTDTERAVRACRRCLRVGGVLAVGFNLDKPDRMPFPLEQCVGLKNFRPYEVPSLGARRTIGGNVFEFYENLGSDYAANRSIP